MPLLLLLLLLSAIALSPGGSGYFTCLQNMKLVTNKFKAVLVLPFCHFTILPYYSTVLILSKNFHIL